MCSLSRTQLWVDLSSTFNGGRGFGHEQTLTQRNRKFLLSLNKRNTKITSVIDSIVQALVMTPRISVGLVTQTTLETSR